MNHDNKQIEIWQKPKTQLDIHHVIAEQIANDLLKDRDIAKVAEYVYFKLKNTNK